MAAFVVAALWLLVSNLVWAQPASTPDWRVTARRLIGEPYRVRDASIEQLRRHSGLEAQIRTALRSRDRNLALDVISALNWTQMIPELSHDLSLERQGWTVLCLNSLATPENRVELTRVYLKQMYLKKLPATPVLIAMIDGLSRWGAIVPDDLRERLWKEGQPEAKLALLQGLKTRSALYKKDFPLVDLRKGLAASDWQTKSFSMAVVAEIKKQSEFLEEAKRLKSDGDERIRRMALETWGKS